VFTWIKEQHHVDCDRRGRGRADRDRLHRIRQVAPEAGATGLRAVRDLADVIFVCVKAIEGIVDVLARHGRLTTGSSNRWAHRGTRQSRYDSLGQDEDDRFELGDDDEYEPDDERF
jgi:hypothetical protein